MDNLPSTDCFVTTYQRIFGDEFSCKQILFSREILLSLKFKLRNFKLCKTYYHVCIISKLQIHPYYEHNGFETNITVTWKSQSSVFSNII